MNLGVKFCSQKTGSEEKSMSYDLDIYFNNNYGKLYEKADNGRAEVVEYKSFLGIVKNQFIVREIPQLLDGYKYFDITTPYGYGGPCIVQCGNDKKALLEEYYKAFKKYCLENNIVSEFVRFHPVLNNIEDFKSIYQTQIIRSTLGTNLKDFDDPVQSEFSKGCRQRIRTALNKGIEYKVTEKPENLHSFKEIYYSTMDRNKATNYYYFDDDYFEDCLKYFKDNIILVEAIFENKVIATDLCFAYNKIINIHLSGTLSEYIYLSPTYILRYAATLWGKEKGYKLIHYGGGRSNSRTDNLFLFKKKFAKNTEFEFGVGKNIWNEDIYNKLCSSLGVDSNCEYFPAYRRK
jgi:serine/alanine adding enzyme